MVGSANVSFDRNIHPLLAEFAAVSVLDKGHREPFCEILNATAESISGFDNAEQATIAARAAHVHVEAVSQAIDLLDRHSVDRIAFAEQYLRDCEKLRGIMETAAENLLRAVCVRCVDRVTVSVTAPLTVGEHIMLPGLREAYVRVFMDVRTTGAADGTNG